MAQCVSEQLAVGGNEIRSLLVVGHRGESEAEVVGGLRPGERVILYPSDRVTDGLRVRGG